MIKTTDLIEKDIQSYLKQHENKELLRFITCGSVDDGKSTLIGRLLHDSKLIFEDHLKAIEKESKSNGSAGDKLDLALLVDGLQSEREQGITIDVAYRYFATDKRKFIIADTPGHEQYTRNMATGASTAELAIILIDGRYGVQTQTKRHSFIVSLLGIKNIIVAVNKMDLIGFSKESFEEIQKEYLDFSRDLLKFTPTFIPISALDGDNIVSKSSKTPWYQGKSLIEELESIPLTTKNFSAFRFPVQYVSRPDLSFRGFSGTVAGGEIAVGDEIIAFPSLKKSRVKQIVTFDGNIQKAFTKQAVTLTLENEIDISRGDLLTKEKEKLQIGKDLDTNLIWLDDAHLKLHHRYLFKIGTKTTSGVFTEISYIQDINTLEKISAVTLTLNEIALVQIALEEEIAFDPYEKNRQTGSLIVIDRETNATIAAGMIVKKSFNTNGVRKKRYTQAEIELNSFIRRNYPEWETKPIE